MTDIILNILTCSFLFTSGLWDGVTFSSTPPDMSCVSHQKPFDFLSEKRKINVQFVTHYIDCNEIRVAAFKSCDCPRYLVLFLYSWGSNLD